MKINKTNIILYFILIITIIIAIFSLLKTKQLREELSALKEIAIPKSESKEMNSADELLAIDALLVNGEYESAIDAYKTLFDLSNDSKNTKELQFRLKLAQQLEELSLGSQAVDSISFLEGVNNSKVIEANPIPDKRPTSVRQYDSLNFVLKKTRVQLENVKNQLVGKSLGKYLTFKNSKKHKVHYIGQVKNSKANGVGVAILDTGSRYEGEWVDNHREGKGKFFWPDGQRYEGEYKNDRRNGKGTYFWLNGEKYIGEWKNDQRNGSGIFYTKNNKIITKGIWKNDKLVKEE